MFSRSSLLKYGQELCLLLKWKVCDKCCSDTVKCTSIHRKLSQIKSRSSHWSAQVRSDVLPNCRQLPGLELTNKNTESIMDSYQDNYYVVDMELGNSSTSSDEDYVQEEQYSEKRPIEYTSYGLELKGRKSGKKSAYDFVTVATYNVLSQTLLEMHRWLYSQCKKSDLKWSRRSARLLKDFAYLNPDVFCLQEVEEAHLESFFKKELSKLGYEGVYKKRTGSKVDGCAIFYKTSKFSVVDERKIELYKENIRLLDRDNIGIILQLALKAEPSRKIVVATTHLLYTPRRTDIRLTQTQMMLAEIERAAYKGDNSYLPIIYTGDMNYTPHSVVYDLVEQGFTRYDSTNLVSSQYSRSKSVLLPRSLGVTDSCQFVSAMKERETKEEENVHYGSGALDHRLNLGSAYTHVKNDLVEASTYQDAWHTVDYIFYSQKMEKGSRKEGELRLVSRLGLPDSEEAPRDLGRIPNSSCGSDHLPLLATFHWLPS